MNKCKFVFVYEVHLKKPYTNLQFQDMCCAAAKRIL